MREENIFTSAAMELNDEIRGYKEEASRSQQTKFMHQDVSPSHISRQRLDAMPEEERKAFIKNMDSDAFKRMVKGWRNA